MTLSYVSTVFEDGKPGPHDEVIGTDTVAVPDSSVKGEAQDWDIRYLLESKKAALQGYLESTGTLQEQLAAVETALANDPNSVSDLVWKHKLLRQHNREAQAWKLFEQRLLEPMLSEMNYRSATVLGQYLIYLPSVGRMGDVDALVSRWKKSAMQELRRRIATSWSRRNRHLPRSGVCWRGRCTCTSGCGKFKGTILWWCARSRAKMVLCAWR